MALTTSCMFPYWRLANVKLRSESETPCGKLYQSTIPASAAPAKPKKRESPQIEHVIVVRVYDRFENMSAAKAVIRGN